MLSYFCKLVGVLVLMCLDIVLTLFTCQKVGTVHTRYDERQLALL